MIVLDQRKGTAYNLNAARTISVEPTSEDEFYPPWYIDMDGYGLGIYESESQAREIFNDLITKWQGGGCSFYEMP